MHILPPELNYTCTCQELHLKLVMKQQILMVKTSQFTTKCKNNTIIALKQQKSKSLLNYNHKTHHLVIQLNLVIDRFKCYSVCFVIIIER